MPRCKTGPTSASHRWSKHFDVIARNIVGEARAIILRPFPAVLSWQWAARSTSAASSRALPIATALKSDSSIATHKPGNAPTLAPSAATPTQSNRPPFAYLSFSNLLSKFVASVMKGSASTTVGGAGSNWKALKKTLNSDASTSASSTSPLGRRKASTLQPKSKRPKVDAALNDSEGNRTSSPAPTSLPWFAEDISPQDLELVRQSASDMSRSGQWEGIMDAKLKKEVILSGLPSDANPAKKEPGNYLAIDCEMVGVGEKGSESILARVSIVNFHGATIMDRFVKPQEKVTDYRTWVSGVRPRDLKDAPSFSEVQGEVANLIKGRILVGHAIQNDLKALLLSHPKPLIRDTSTFQPLRDLAKTKYPSLKKLAKLALGIDIQLEGESHSSVEDARATMAVFRSQKSKWDEMLRSRAHGGLGGGHGISSRLTSRAGAAPNKVWKPPANGEAVDAASPALNRRSRSSSAAGGGAVLQDTVQLKPRLAAKADWWKESI